MYGSRGRGQTTSLVGLLLANPKARMVVDTYHFKRSLSRQYGLEENRFITVDELRNGGDIGMDGPLFYDDTAVMKLVELARDAVVPIYTFTKTPVNQNVYKETKDFMELVLEYSKKHNIAVTFTPL